MKMNKISKLRRLLLTKKVKHKPLDSIVIDEYALIKMHLYAALAKEISNEPLECYGYLITPNSEDDGIVRDVVLSKQQVVTTTTCLVDTSSEFQTIEEIQSKGYKVLGWWHSHGNFSPFHSAVDVSNFERLSKILYSHNKWPVSTSYEEVEENSIEFDETQNILYIKSNSNPRQKYAIHFDRKSKNRPNIKKIIREDSQTEGFAYSIVVNSNSDTPYRELSKNNRNYKDPRISIKNKGQRPITEEELQMIASETAERIIYKGIPIGEKKGLGEINLKAIYKRIRENIDSYEGEINSKTEYRTEDIREKLRAEHPEEERETEQPTCETRLKANTDLEKRVRKTYKSPNNEHYPYRSIIQMLIERSEKLWRKYSAEIKDILNGVVKHGYSYKTQA